MANPYRELLAIPGLKGLVIAGSVARLPQAMIGIGILTMLVQETGRYWLAGAVTGTFTLANALVGPQISKLVDRRGQSRVLPPVTAFSAGMLLALIAAVYWQGAEAVFFILAALAGAMPSMPAMIRARLTHIFHSGPQLNTAFSLDTVLNEITYIIGAPLAIGLSSSLFAEAGPLAAVALLIIGVTAFLLQRRTEPQVIAGPGKNTPSTLLIPGVRTIVLALLTMGLTGGAIDVAIVAFANAQGWPASASFILAIFALGSVISGLLFGAVKVPLPLEKQFLIGVLITAVTSLLPMFSPDVYVLSGILFLTGMAFAPTMVVVMNLGTAIVPASLITEGLTWMTTGISIGVALGSMIAGVVIDTYGARAGFAVPIFAVVAMVVIALSGLRVLRTASANCAGPR